MIYPWIYATKSIAGDSSPQANLANFVKTKLEFQKKKIIITGTQTSIGLIPRDFQGLIDFAYVDVFCTYCLLILKSS